MKWDTGTAPKAYKAYTRRNFMSHPIVKSIPEEMLRSIQAVSAVFPFRVNNYVIEALIDWNKAPDDPIFQLTFPQNGMLPAEDRDRLLSLMDAGAPDAEVHGAARKIQTRFNPHPAGQMDLNVPVLDGEILDGMQHKYRETVLFFPSHGQTCHAYCTYCFRWAQFVGVDKLKFACSDPRILADYLSMHPEVTDVLFTGGDPLTMGTKILRRYLEPLIRERPGNLASIRIGTKVPAYWPYRFLTDHDADDLIRLFSEIVDSGLHLAIMAHFSHDRELSTPAAQTAIKRILDTGAMVRCQAPLMRHINADPRVWANMWNTQVRLGATPYYMFMARDTGPEEYFKVSLAEAVDIFTGAYSQVSGLGRTVRGPSMSATPGKVLVDGVAEIDGEKVFVLKFIQGRHHSWVNRIFFAEYDPAAHWLDDLKPASGEKEFFYAEDLRRMKRESRRIFQ